MAAANVSDMKTLPIDERDQLRSAYRYAEEEAEFKAKLGEASRVAETASAER